jgi:DNA repair exonuclease SbcCD ATPase subunit
MQSIETTKAQVQARAQQADQLRQELASKLAELARLDEADNKLIIETLRDADAKRSEIESVQARFQAAADQVRSQLLQMREKLSRYLAA